MNVTDVRLPRPAGGFFVHPLVQVAMFSVLFLVCSIVGIIPISLVTGRTVVGIWYILPFSVVFVLLYQRLAHRESLAALGFGLTRASFVSATIGFFGIAGLVAAITAVHAALGWVHVTGNHVRGVPIVDVGLGLLLALALNLGIGIGEELIFRGYILRRLLIGYSSYLPGVILSGALYSLIHIQAERDPLVLIDLFVLGIVLGLTVVLTRSIWMAIGIHMGWDFWTEGIYFYQMPGAKVSRVVDLQYTLANTTELIVFKLIVATSLLAVAAWLVARIRQQGAWAAGTDQTV